MLYLIITAVIICLATISITQWIEGIPTLYRADYSSCVGFYNHSIYLLGGFDKQQQLTEYLIPDNTFIDHGGSYFSPSNIKGFSQYWTQIDNILYFFNYVAETIAIFDMQTNSFTSSYISNLPTTGFLATCITSSSTHLFLVGGQTSGTYIPTSNVDIYNLSNHKWQTDVPSMQIARSIFSCIFHAGSNKLYAIAGEQQMPSYIYLDSIEKIEINDILQNVNAWTYIEPLSEKLSDTRCVAYKNMIYIIGGYNKFKNDGNTTSNKVHVINVLDDTVTLFADSLSMGLSDVAPIIVDHILYVFSGYIDSGETGINTWMTYDLYMSTAAPSSVPTTHISTAYPITSSPQTEQPNYSTSVPTTDPITSDPTQTVYLSTSLDPTMNPNQQTTETSNPALTTTESTSYPSSQSTEMISYPTLSTSARITSISTDSDDSISGIVSSVYGTEPATDSTVDKQSLLEFILLGLFVVSSVLIVCIIVFWRKQKRAKEDLRHMSEEEPNTSDQQFVECVNSTNDLLENKDVSLEGIRKEGEGNEIVNNDINAGTTRGFVNDVNDKEEYQNNPNIPDQTFVECVDSGNDLLEGDDNKAVSLQCVRKEGEGNEIVNNDMNTGTTRGFDGDMNDEEEQQNNPNISRDEFIIQEDENHETRY